jgi:hypothetical protein
MWQMVANNICCKRKQENDNTICVQSMQKNESRRSNGVQTTKELRPYLVDPHKQTLIDLQYHVEKLKTDGNEVLIFMDANQAEEQIYQAPTHNEKFVTQKGFHVDESIDCSLQSFIQNCGTINVLR